MGKTFHGRLAAIGSRMLVLAFLTAGQAGLGQTVLDEYVVQALRSNLVLQERKVSLEKALLAIREAKSLFGPSVSFETQYSLAQGGRRISFPVGDLLNPVYATLNQLTASSRFPQIANVEEQFLPDNFYDVRIRTSMPIYNPDIRINRDIRMKQSELSQADLDTYRRELVREVKSAYYDHLMTRQAVAILESSLALVEEGLRLNRTLLANGKGLPAQVARAEAELASVEARLASARSDRRNAAARLNFIVNRPLTDSVKSVEPELPLSVLQVLTDSVPAQVRNREELRSLDVATRIGRDVLRLGESYRKPRVGAFLDLASQGFDFQFDRRSAFYLGGVSLQMPLYAGGRNRMKVRQAELDLQALASRTEYVGRQLELAVLVARNAVRDAHASWQAALREEQASVQYHKLVDRGYREGANTYIELLDARNQLSSSRLQTVIRRCSLLKSLAAYERETAAYTLPQINN